MSLSKLRVTPFSARALDCARWFVFVIALSGGTHSFAAAQAPAAPPPAPAPSAPPAPPQAYPQQYPPQYPPQYQAYPQQYPQYQAYPQQYPQTVYVQPQLRQPRKPGPRRSLMIAGASVLLASYGVAVVTGAALVDGECRTCEDVGWSLLIPVAGPYIAAGVADKGKGMLVLLGTVQVIGVGLTIGGGIQYAMTKRAAQNSALSLKLRRGRDVSFDVATSPRMMGPTMKLRF